MGDMGALCSPTSACFCAFRSISTEIRGGTGGSRTVHFRAHFIGSNHAMNTKPVLSLEEVKRIVSAAEAEAAANQ